jgi:aldose 1-epimerase
MTGTPFGKTPDGTSVQSFTLRNGKGVEITAITYGCALVSIRVPDREGRPADVVLGCDTLEGYLANGSYLGALCGRYANRIADGRFELEGKTYQLAVNKGGNHLHGGMRGFDKVVWKAEPFQNADGQGVVFTHVSPDGDESYPGTLHLRVTYTLTEKSELAIEYHATTDKTTVVNLTQHSYFNLAGAGTGSIVGHEIQIHASRITPVNDRLIPTGELMPVEGTPFDFRKPAVVGARIDNEHEQLVRGRGYDHNFVLDHPDGVLSHAARLIEPLSGRRMDVHTDQPSMQFYSGNYLDGSIVGKGGVPYTARYGLCLETQHFPDTPNKPHFPSAVVRPGTDYRTRTVFTFGLA